MIKLGLTTKNHIEDDHLEVLLEEYKNCLQHAQQHQQNIIQILSISAGALVISVGYLFEREPTIPLTIAWIIPLLTLGVYAITIMQVGALLSHYWIARILAQRINLLMPEIVLTRHISEFPSASYFSLFRGDVRFRLGILVIVLTLIVIFLYVTIFAFQIVYEASHFAGICFVFIYCFLAFTQLTTLWSILTELPRRFRILAHEIQSRNRMPTALEMRKAISSVSHGGIRTIVYNLAPRPYDIYGKGIFFWYGFAIAYAVVGIDSTRLPLITTLFSNTSQWFNIMLVPQWVVYALGAIYFLTSEILLQQGKLLWDDIRDIERDKKIPFNKNRAVASGILSLAAARYHMILRLTVALLFGYLLGGTSLLVMYIVVLLHQAVYVLWAKPRGERYPLLVLSIGSLNFSLRYLTGVISVAGPYWIQLITFLPIVLLYFQSFGCLARLWRVEATHMCNTGQQVNIRPQSTYFLLRGRFWQNLGFIAAILVSVATISIYLETHALHNAVLPGAEPVTLPIVNYISRLADTITRLWHFANVVTSTTSELSIVRNVLTFASLSSMIIALIVVFGLLSALIIATLLPFRWLATKIGLLKRLEHKVAPLSTIMFLLAAVSFLAGLRANDSGLVLLSLLLLNTSHLIISQTLTYLDYTMTKVRLRLASLGEGLDKFIFQSDSEYDIRTILNILFSR